MKWFEDAEDRDSTLILVAVFLTFGGLVVLFRDKVSAEVVAGLLGTLAGSIATMVQSFFRKGKQVENQPEKMVK